MTIQNTTESAARQTLPLTAPFSLNKSDRSTIVLRKRAHYGLSTHPHFCLDFLLRYKLTWRSVHPAQVLLIGIPNAWGCSETGLHTLQAVKNTAEHMVLSLWCHTLFALLCMLSMLWMSDHPLFEPNERCTAHWLSFTRLQYMYTQHCILGRLNLDATSRSLNLFPDTPLPSH